jgi:hypothetical protein
VVIDNLSDNMLKAWQDGDNCWIIYPGEDLGAFKMINE